MENAKMKSLNAKLVLSALGIVAMLTSPAFAQKPHRDPSQQQHTSDPVLESGGGIYDMVPNPGNPDSPEVTGGGSIGYNQSLRDNTW
jgi:hypothetical protein